MESRDNDLRDLRSSREQNRLSLRKRNIQDIIIKKRTGYNNINYTLDSKKIIVKPEYKDKRFNTLLDLLLFSSQIFQDEKSDINDIKFVIYLLKQSQIKNDIKNEVSDSNILKDIVIVLNKYINDVVVVDELISLLINFTFYLETETNMNLITNDYMKLYSSISSKYSNDNTIFNDLIILLGNLSNDNSSAQKIFYNTKLFDEIYNLAKNPKSPKDKKDISIFFLGNFSIGISKNKDLVNNM